MVGRKPRMKIKEKAKNTLFFLKSKFKNLINNMSIKQTDDEYEIYGKNIN